MHAPIDLGRLPEFRSRLVIWHTEGTAISGLLSWMWRLKKSLPAAGIELTLVSLELQPFRFAQVCPQEGVYDVRIRTPQEFLAFLKQRRTSVHLINHAYEYVDLLQKLSPSLLSRLSLVGICHTDQDYYYKNLQRLDPLLAGLIAVSPHCAETLEQMLPHRLGTIPVLPDWDMPLDTVPPVRRSDPAKPLQVLFNGRILHLQKRVLDLPDIARKLTQAEAPVELTIAGDGPDLPKLREALGQGTQVSCRLLPALAPWEMPELLARHDVFLQLSEFEGASVSLMEAMAAGLVPVVTRTASGTELLEDGRNALLCPVGDTNAIAETLAGLARERSRLPDLSAAAFGTARESLQKLDYARSLGNFLESLHASSLISHPASLTVF